MTNTIPEKDHAKFRKLYLDKNVRIDSLANIFDCTAQAIKETAKKLGLPHRKYNWTCEMKSKNFKCAFFERCKSSGDAIFPCQPPETEVVKRIDYRINPYPSYGGFWSADDNRRSMS